MIQNDKNTPRLLGRLHMRDNSFENLFICSCGNSIWIKNLVESARAASCGRCSSAFMLLKKEGRYQIAVQDKLWKT